MDDDFSSLNETIDSRIRKTNDTLSALKAALKNEVGGFG